MCHRWRRRIIEWWRWTRLGREVARVTWCMCRGRAYTPARSPPLQSASHTQTRCFRRSRLAICSSESARLPSPFPSVRRLPLTVRSGQGRQRDPGRARLALRRDRRRSLRCAHRAELAEGGGRCKQQRWAALRDPGCGWLASRSDRGVTRLPVRLRWELRSTGDMDQGHAAVCEVLLAQLFHRGEVMRELGV